MKKVKSSFLGMLLSLTLISAVAAVLLGKVFGVTDTIIRDMSEKNKLGGILDVVVPGCTDFSAYTISEPASSGGSNVYCVYYTADSSFVGMAVESSDNGFGGELTVLFGFNPDWEITGYKVMKHSETPGLGAQVDLWFKSGSAVSSGADVFSAKRKRPVESTLVGTAVGGSHNIIGVNMSAQSVSLSKDGGTVDAITASTITSRAFMRTLKKAYAAANPGAVADAVTGASRSGNTDATTAPTSVGATDAVSGATQISENTVTEPELTFVRRNKHSGKRK